MHGGGEEFLVLEGVFQDEHGDFPAGCYVRNPPQSRHTPGSKPGCTMFVKLWQFDLAERRHVRLDTNKMALLDVKGRDGVRLLPLFKDAHEDVRLEQWAPGAAIEFDPNGGFEVLVLEGGFREGGETYGPQSWLRLPIGTPLARARPPTAAASGIKKGRLRHVQAARPMGEGESSSVPSSIEEGSTIGRQRVGRLRRTKIATRQSSENQMKTNRSPQKG